jgi:TrpR-related protein YerC/YecD
MPKSIKSDQLDQLFQAILTLDNVEECYQLFEDLCTIQELKDMGLRYEVATLLNDGQSYQHIADITKTSTATISRVSKSLEYGNDGYKLVIKRTKEQNKD